MLTNRRRLITAFFALLLISVFPLNAEDALTNDSIIKMVSAGLGDTVLVSMINTQATEFELGADDLVALKEAGVSDTVLSAMVMKGSGAVAAPSSQPGGAAAAEGPPVAEIGVYYKKDGKWTEVTPEVVNWKTGGVLKSIATVGVVKGDVNGRINTPHSSTSVTIPVEFLVYTPEGVSITEYQLINLREKKKAREFRTITGGVFHVSGGAQRDLLPCTSDKLAPRTYAVTMSNWPAGEYGFLPPGMQGAQSASAQLGKMHTFRILE